MKTLLVLVLLGLVVFAVVQWDTSSKTAAGNVANASSANDPPGSSVPRAPSSNDGGPPAESPSAFFPHSIGAQWVYAISLGPAVPLEYRVVKWPSGGGAVAIAERGRFPAASHADSSSFLLSFRVLRSTSTQASSRYPDGVELAVDQDDLGIFEHHDHLFWAATSDDRFMVDEVTSYPPDTPGAPGGGAWGSWGQADGEGRRLVFFADKPGTEIGYGDDPADTLLLVGTESCTGTPCLHFVRAVRAGEAQTGIPNTPDSRYLDSSFTEDTWFAKDTGLIRLEQRVNGRLSMSWSLQRYAPGQ